jgi:hypothetical protein
MKKIFSILGLMMFAVSLFAAKGLVITQKYFSEDLNGTVKVTWYVSETQCKMKMEFSDGKVNTVSWFIPDLTSNKLITYMEGNVPPSIQKTYFSIPVQTIEADKTMNASRVSVNRTGETKTVSGIVCEKIIVKTNKYATEMWVTKDFKADFYKFYPFFQSSFELLGLSEERMQGVPLFSTMKDNSGKVLISYELVSVTQTELTPADFTVPAEYKSAEEIAKEKK